MSKPVRQPVVYLPHGGGPWPFVPLGFPQSELDALAAYLKALPGKLPAPPTALLVVSAHWEASVPTVMTALRPPMLYDYFGFPEAAYRVTWAAPGAAGLASRVVDLLARAGIPSATDPHRGFDHGTFVPLKLSFPSADVPTTQLSLIEGLSPGAHLALGRALAPLRDEGVLIVGSGMSFHNLRTIGRAEALTAAAAFDGWLHAAVLSDPAERDRRLEHWTDAPSARAAHPREEHLLPLMVVAGAAGTDAASIAFEGALMGAKITGVHFGGAA